jgi:hypothetical protein
MTGGPISKSYQRSIRIELDYFFKLETVAGFNLTNAKYDKVIDMITNFCKNKKYKTFDELKRSVSIPRMRLLGIESDVNDFDAEIIDKLENTNIKEIIRNALILSLTTDSMIYDYERPVILSKKNLDRVLVFYKLGGIYEKY